MDLSKESREISMSQEAAAKPSLFGWEIFFIVFSSFNSFSIAIGLPSELAYIAT